MLHHTLLLILTLFDPLSAQYAESIATHSQQYGIHPLLVAAVMYQESKFQNGLCYRGSHGLMQIQLRGRSCSRSRAQAEQERLYDPDENIRRGVEAMRYWRRWCRSQGHEHHWLYHYNQGFGSCPRDRPGCKARERQVFTQGRARGYVTTILRVFGRLQKIKARVEKGQRHERKREPQRVSVRGGASEARAA